MWGTNIIRNAAALGALAAVIDTDNMRASDFAKQFNCDALSLQEALQRDDISGLMIATDATTHFDIATIALQAGKHVFIEKPMAMSLAEAKRLRRRQTARINRS